MATQTRTLAELAQGSVRLALEYDDSQAQPDVAAIVLTAPGPVSVTVTDLANGHNRSAVLAPGRLALPAGLLSMAAPAGFAGPGDGLAGRLSISVRYPV